MSEPLGDLGAAPVSAAIPAAVAPVAATAAPIAVARAATGGTPTAAMVPFRAVLVLAFAVLLWTAYQTYALWSERENLLAAATQITVQVEAATKIRASVDSLAAGVKRLSEGGNANARVVVDELARRGITINPNSAPSAVPAK